jgi:hypothetical protein
MKWGPKRTSLTDAECRIDSVRGMWTRLVTSALAVLALGGCGDEEGGGDAEPVTAASFVDCFEKPGFQAVRPKPREESVLAFQAKSKGYEVEPVNVQEAGALVPHAFIVFFESGEKATEATEELRANSLGPVPPQRLGPAVIGYGDEENRAAVEAAIRRCIEG